MTDIDIREEVTTTTSTVIQALTLPVDLAMFQEVRRFGFEYEMLPSGRRDHYSESAELETHMAEWWDVEYESDDFCCDDCSAGRATEERREYRRIHGLGRDLNPSGGPYDLIQRAHDAGLIADNSRCDYHCQCENCAHDRSYPLLTAQADGSCGVEFVSRIIDCNEFDNGSAPVEIGQWVALMNGWKDDGLWMPDGITSNGNHVHVSADGDIDGTWNETATRRMAFQHIDALYAAFDWRKVADGGCGQIRGYNSKPDTNGGGGSWLSDRGYGTFEHRLWNTPSDPERLWAHLGISIGIQRWAFNIAVNMPEFKFWDTGTTSRYGYAHHTILDETYKALTDNVGEVVRGIRAYIPNHDQFTIARDLIVLIMPVT